MWEGGGSSALVRKKVWGFAGGRRCLVMCEELPRRFAPPLHVEGGFFKINSAIGGVFIA